MENPFYDNAMYEEIVKGPGKFEGEARYVPYYWDVFLQGYADGDDGQTLTFDVTDKDVERFPELSGRKQVQIFERSDGFVCEC